MDTVGTFAPETEAAVHERREALGPTAQVVVREVAKAMAFDREEYRERVTGDVVLAARDALFAHTLAVTVGTRAEFEAWREDHPDYAVYETGSGNVDRVAWHAAPFAREAAAATFQDEREAAVGALRRQAFGRIYRDLLYGEAENGEGAAGEDGTDRDDRDDRGGEADGGDADAPSTGGPGA